jgi:hypothetical protein
VCRCDQRWLGFGLLPVHGDSVTVKLSFPLRRILDPFLFFFSFLLPLSCFESSFPASFTLSLSALTHASIEQPPLRCAAFVASLFFLTFICPPSAPLYTAVGELHGWLKGVLGDDAVGSTRAFAD